MAHHLINLKQGLDISINNKKKITCTLYTALRFQRLTTHMPQTKKGKKMKTTCGQIVCFSHRKRSTVIGLKTLSITNKSRLQIV